MKFWTNPYLHDIYTSELSKFLSRAPTSSYLPDVKHTAVWLLAGRNPKWLTTPLIFLSGVCVEFKQPRSQCRKIFSNIVLQKNNKKIHSKHVSHISHRYASALQFKHFSGKYIAWLKFYGFSIDLFICSE